MLHYIIQTVAFQLLFLLVYDLFLKRETFFNWNRLYLLLTPILSLVIPSIKINQFSNVVPQNYVVRLPEVFVGDKPTSEITMTNLEPVILQAQSFSFWETVFYSGMFIVASIFIYKMFVLIRLILKNPRFRKRNLVIVQLLRSTSAFSFFNYIFLGERIETSEKKAILKHEMVHVREKHSWDLLFFEVLKIMFWFNPLVYMYQKRIQALHEYIADAEALKLHGKQQYYQNLLSQVFETKRMSFINPFFKQSLIKKRIIMLSKPKSRQINLLKYSLLLPIILGMLIYSSCNNEVEHISIENQFSDKKLKEKLIKEFTDLKQSGMREFEIMKHFMPKSDNYILTKEEYMRQNILIEFVVSKHIEMKNNVKDHNLKTYDEYLEMKKTDGAKEIWENNTYDGVLKLVVDDMKNLTDKEKEKLDKKMALLQKDDFFTKLIQTDGYTTIVLGETESKKEYNREESKFALAIDVPFGVVEQVPTFAECESGTNEERKTCTSQNIPKFVAKNFNTKLASDLNLKGRLRINVIFKISPEGNATDVRARGPHPKLEKEAERVIKMLPKFIPGKHKGKPVSVPYSLPIIFQVAD